MKRILNIIWQDVRSGKNIDVYITIVFAFMVAGLYITDNIDQRIVFSAILTILALVTINSLITRIENKEIVKTIRELDGTTGFAGKFLKDDFDRTILANHLQNSRKALFWGFSFVSTIPFLRDEIDRGLKSGLDIKFLLVEPSSDAAKMSVFGNRPGDFEEFNHAINANLSQLSRHIKWNSQGKLEAKIINYMPTVKLLAFDPDLPSGIMFVRLTTFRTQRQRSPWFELSNTNDSKWFNFFLEQFDLAWNEAESVDLANFQQ